MSIQTSIKSLLLIVCLSVAYTGHTQTQRQIQVPSLPDQVTPSSQNSGAMTPDEILKLFQREARAAYAEARQACQAISDSKEKEICLARARLNFDADMRYAQKRADMGY